LNSPVDCATDRRFVAAYLSETANSVAGFAADTVAQDLMFAMSDAIAGTMRDGRKLLIAGNGGSAADAQHIAGEFISRLMYDRAPLPAIALTTDTSSITATANDYGYEHVFERQVLGLGRPGDVFLAISTSGNSPNVLRALDAARGRGLVTLGFTGAGGGGMRAKTDLLLAAPSDRTAIIQQIHIIAAHVICALVERALCPPPDAG
jgi:D-sedoheptulose 7-phosphate isomerase